MLDGESPAGRGGVLLLNATLTVRANNAGSHQNKGWESFTDAVIRKISNDKTGLVFMLWGGYAMKKGAVILSHPKAKMQVHLAIPSAIVVVEKLMT